MVLRMAEVPIESEVYRSWQSLGRPIAISRSNTEVYALYMLETTDGWTTRLVTDSRVDGAENWLSEA
jgi:hypothetical protein